LVALPMRKVPPVWLTTPEPRCVVPLTTIQLPMVKKPAVRSTSPEPLRLSVPRLAGLLLVLRPSPKEPLSSVRLPPEML